MSGYDAAKQRSGAFEEPAWCRLDLCQEPTWGGEIDHHTGPEWQLVPASWPERRVNLAVTRSDMRERGVDAVEVGAMLVELTLDHQVTVSGLSDEAWMWEEQDGGRLWVNTSEARNIGRQLIALADRADAAVTAPEVLNAD